MTHRRSLPLSTLLALRIIAVSAVAFAVVVGLFFALYMTDRPALRRATLVATVDGLVREWRAGRDPAALEEFRSYPKAYAFRIFEHGSPGSYRVLAEANGSLLPDPAEAPARADFTVGLDPSFHQLGAPDGSLVEDGWLLTEVEAEGKYSVWVQTAMIGDPGMLWVRAIGKGMADQGVVPALLVVPFLALAIFVTARRALRPLQLVAEQARSIGGAVDAGRPLAKLAADGLPLEFQHVVTAMNAMLQQLDRSMGQQRQFASDAAHELRTPLSVLVLELAELPHSPATERIAAEMANLTQLIDQLLRFAQADALMAGDRHAVDVAATTRKICEDLAPVAAHRGQTIEFDVRAGQVAACGHAVLADVAIRNIVENALRHSGPDSTVMVAVEKGPRVVVDDCGPGVPDAHKEHIFSRCWRANRSRPDGAGIGLALVERVAQLHGGNVQVQDRPGGGARFVLTLAAWQDA